MIALSTLSIADIHDRRLRSVAWKLTLAGLLPFAACDVGFLIHANFFHISPAFAMTAYGAIILSFMSGTVWTRGLLPQGNSQLSVWILALSVLPALSAWVGLLIGNKEGIVIGDPTENCLSIIITRDGGKIWKKTVCGSLPNVTDGEAAFAASNTNICIKGNKTWIVSGGKKSRVFYSPDKGISWAVFETPIVQGQAMTGIFTVDFYDDKIGVIAGGNYEAQNQNFQNKAITFDGGKTWKLLAENTGFGYASCIQFVPNSGGRQLVTVGTSGLYYSADSGNNWKQLLEDKTLYTIRFLDKTIAVAAGKDKIIKIEFKK